MTWEGSQAFTMIDIKRSTEYAAPRVIVDAIVGFLREREFKSIHYLGYADDELINSLIHEGRYTLSLIDWWDRHHREGISFCEDEGLDHSDLLVPGWLDGIPTYSEGAPWHEVLLHAVVVGTRLGHRRACCEWLTYS